MRSDVLAESLSLTELIDDSLDHLFKGRCVCNQFPLIVDGDKYIKGQRLYKVLCA